MATSEFSDDDLIILFDALWAMDDVRLDLFDPDDMSVCIDRVREAKAVLQPYMDERGIRSPLEEHVVGVDRFRRPSDPDAPPPTSRP